MSTLHEAVLATVSEIEALRIERDALAADLLVERAKVAEFEPEAMDARELRKAWAKDAESGIALGSLAVVIMSHIQFLNGRTSALAADLKEAMALHDDALRQVLFHSKTAEAAEAREKRLATDALVALAGARIATPEKGYVVEPHCLGNDIGTLARERDAALEQLEALFLGLNVAGIEHGGDVVRACEGVAHLVVKLEKSRDEMRSFDLVINAQKQAKLKAALKQLVTGATPLLRACDQSGWVDIGNDTSMMDTRKGLEMASAVLAEVSS